MKDFLFLIESFEVGISTLDQDLLKWEDPPLTWDTASDGSLHEAHGRRKLLFFACLLWLSVEVHSFTGIGACFGIPV